MEDRSDDLSHHEWMLLPQSYISLLASECQPKHFYKCYLLYTILRSFHSRKLHIFGFLANTMVTSSLVIFFFCLSVWASYHFCSRSLPCRLNSNINCIWKNTKNKKNQNLDNKNEGNTNRPAGLLSFSMTSWLLAIQISQGSTQF